LTRIIFLSTQDCITLFLMVINFYEMFICPFFSQVINRFYLCVCHFLFLIKESNQRKSSTDDIQRIRAHALIKLLH
jgi:hypothetical protein